MTSAPEGEEAYFTHTSGSAHNTPHSTKQNAQSQSKRRPTSAAAPKVNAFTKTLHHITNEELDKLREIIAEKDEIIQRLSRKLSHARAYPLKGINTTVERNSDDENMNITASNTNLNSSSHKISMNFIDDETESESESFLAEEEARHLRRVDMAVELQKMKNERKLKTKAGNPPHIRAIREAKSFAESVTDKFNLAR